MHWLSRVLATIGFFLLAVFGGQQASVAFPSTQSPDTNLTSSITGGSGYILQNGKVFYYEVSTYAGDATDTAEVSKSEVVGADPATFWMLDSVEARDANHFYSNGIPVPLSGDAVSKLHLVTLKEIGSNIFTDQKAVYTMNEVGNILDGGSELVKVIPGADPVSFAILPDPVYSGQSGTHVTYSSSYARDKNSVYFLSYPDGYDLVVTKLHGIDPATFKVIGTDCTPPVEPSGGYGVTYVGRDNHTVLAGSKVIQGADPNTFEYVGSVSLNLDILGGGTPTVYEKDKNHVYANCSDIVPGADPATFIIVHPVPKACDLLGVPGANGTYPTFEPGCYDSKDANHEFLQGQMVKTS